MGKRKGSKLEKYDKGKQIQEDSSGNEKDSKCDKRTPISKDQKHGNIKKKSMALLIKHFELSTGKTVPYTQLKTGGIQRPWAAVNKMVKKAIEDLQAKHQLQTQTSFMEQQEVEKAEHMKQSTKLKVVEAAIEVEKTESMAKKLQDYILKEDKTDQDQLSLPMDLPDIDDLEFSTWMEELLMPGTSSGAGTSTAMTSTGEGEHDQLSLPMDLPDIDDMEFSTWMAELLMPGTSSGAGTSTAMTSTGEGEDQNNGVNETFGVE